MQNPDGFTGARRGGGFIVQRTGKDRVQRLAMVALGVAGATVLSLAALLTMLGVAGAQDAPLPVWRVHDAPAGWSYPFSCCSGIDCRPVPAAAIGEGPDGYTVQATGEVIGFGDTRLKHSPDGDFHWCSVAGSDDGRTICLFVPPRSF